LDSKLPKSGGVTPSIASAMWERLGSEYVGIVVFKVGQRTEPAHDSDAEQSCKLEVRDIELARTEDEGEYLRTILRALYRLRTGSDKLDEAGSEAEDDLASARGSLAGILAGEAEARGWTVTMTSQGPIIDLPGVDGADTANAAEYVKRAVRVVVENEHASLASVCRQLRVSAETATAILEILERRGVVGPADELHNREVLITIGDLPALIAELEDEDRARLDAAGDEVVDAEIDDDDQGDGDVEADDVELTEDPALIDV
jgi:hypothetical protein